jgi:signal transduction histidine kinase
METYQFEEKIMIRSCLVLSIILPIATIGNIIFHLDLVTILITGFSSLFFMILYWIGRRNQNFKLLRILITLYAILFLNVMYFHNYGSRGPILCNFLAVLCALIFIWDKKKPVLAIVFSINLLVLWSIELNVSQIIKPYSSEKARIIDMYIGTFISFFFIIGYAFYSKERYTQEYLKKSQSDLFKNAFLINLYGELKIPLKTIVGYSELLEQTENAEKRKQYLNIVSKSSKQLQLFMDDIFVLSLIESNHLTIIKKAVNVKELIKSVKDNIEIERESKAVEITLNNFPSHNYFIKTDAARLKKILHNIILFAVKQTIKGEVKLSIEEKNKKCLIVIFGAKIELAQSEIDLVFNPKDNIESVTDNLTGTILDFFISKKIITLIGGELSIESFPGKGTSFRIELPIDN